VIFNLNNNFKIGNHNFVNMLCGV